MEQEPEVKEKIDVRTSSRYSKNTDLILITKKLKMLWWEKKEKQFESKNLTLIKRRMYQNAMRHLVEEIAAVESISLKKAKEKIHRRLEKIGPQKPKKEKNDKN